MKELVERTIAEQEEMLSANIGEQEKFAVRYCILTLKDLLEKDGTIEVEPLNKKEIREQLEEVKSIVENEVNPVVSPDNWYVYSSLHDELEQLEILLEHHKVI